MDEEDGDEVTKKPKHHHHHHHSASKNQDHIDDDEEEEDYDDEEDEEVCYIIAFNTVDYSSKTSLHKMMRLNMKKMEELLKSLASIVKVTHKLRGGDARRRIESRDS
jgi:hypothetical protein